MRPISRRLILSSLPALAAPSAFARMNQADDDEIARRLEAEGFRVSRPRVEVFVPSARGARAAEACADRVANGIGVVERELGRVLDTARYGDGPIRVFISPEIMPSHVYHGYSHPRFNKPWVYFPLRQATADTEPYLHELTHLVLWKYGSHTLREGFAHHVMLRKPRLSGGVNRIHMGISKRADADRTAGESLRGPLGRSLLGFMGANGIPGLDTAVGDARDIYYVTSYSFVASMLDHMDQDRFMELHVADDVEGASRRVTGRGMEEWRALWLRHLGVENSEIPA